MDDLYLTEVPSHTRESIDQIFKCNESSIVENCLEFVNNLVEDTVEFRLAVILYIKKQFDRSKQLIFVQKYLQSLSEQFRRENPLFVYELRFMHAFAHTGEETDAEIQNSENEYESILQDLDENYPCEAAKCLVQVELLRLRTCKHQELDLDDEYQELADALEACCENMKLHTNDVKENDIQRRFMFRALCYMGRYDKNVNRIIRYYDTALLFAPRLVDKLWAITSILKKLCNSGETSKNLMDNIRLYWEQFKTIVKEICDNECELSNKFYCAALLGNLNATSECLMFYLSTSKDGNTYVSLQEEMIEMSMMGVELGLKYLGRHSVYVGQSAVQTAWFSHLLSNKKVSEYETIGNQVLKLQKERMDSEDERFPLSRHEFQVLSSIYDVFGSLCIRRKHFGETETYFLEFLELSKRYEDIYGTCDFFKSIVARFHYKVGKLYLRNWQGRFSSVQLYVQAIQLNTWQEPSKYKSQNNGNKWNLLMSYANGLTRLKVGLMSFLILRLDDLTSNLHVQISCPAIDAQT